MHPDRCVGMMDVRCIPMMAARAERRAKALAIAFLTPLRIATRPIVLWTRPASAASQRAPPIESHRSHNLPCRRRWCSRRKLREAVALTISPRSSRTRAEKTRDTAVGESTLEARMVRARTESTLSVVSEASTATVLETTNFPPPNLHGFRGQEWMGGSHPARVGKEKNPLLS